MMSTVRKFLPLVAVLVPAFTASPAAADIGDFASGSGSTQPGEEFSFSAVGGPGVFELPTSASGPMSYSGRAFTGTAQAYCLVVEGRRARIRGVITSSTSHPDAVGSGQIQFVVEDRGPGGVGQGGARDRFAGPLTTQDFGCPDPPRPGSGIPLLAGEIVVSGSGLGPDFPGPPQP